MRWGVASLDYCSIIYLLIFFVWEVGQLYTIMYKASIFFVCPERGGA